MESQIDPTVFPDNQAVDKQDLRNQFQIAHDEITSLMNKSSVAQNQMRDDNAWNSV
jgi:hypothetical protein